MRFDLGVRVHDRMRDALTSQATCTERLLLWSALPTTTPAQLDLLAHGPEGLTSRTGPANAKKPGVRGRTSATLRRIKVGSRDVLKLDTIEARLRESGPPLSERLDSIADEVAASIAAHARSLAPRTLMFVFGDHGFRMESCEGVTRAGTSGGASPKKCSFPRWLGSLATCTDAKTVGRGAPRDEIAAPASRGTFLVMALVHGGRLVAQALRRHGTTHLFTLCGGHIQAIYDGCLDEEHPRRRRAPRADRRPRRRRLRARHREARACAP